MTTDRFESASAMGEAMFGGLVRGWRKTRAEVIEEQILDIVRRSNNWPRQYKDEFVSGMCDTWISISADIPDLNNATDEVLRRVGKEVQKDAQQAGQANVARGSGMYFIGAYVEAKGLPGEHAERVVAVTEPMLKQIDALLADAYREYLAVS